jgi:hypothetical protein
MASFPQASPPTLCTLLYPPPYAPNKIPFRGEIIEERTEVRGCFLTFGAESIVFQFAV